MTYTSELNTTRYTQLNRLAIAQITTGKKRLKKEAFTPLQLLNIQRFANRQHPDKDFVIAYE